MSTILIAHIRSTHTIFDKINSFLFQKIKFFSFVKRTTVIVESAEPQNAQKFSIQWKLRFGKIQY